MGATLAGIPVTTETVSKTDAAALCSFAKKHSVDALIAHAILQSGLLETEDANIQKIWEDCENENIRRAMILRGKCQAVQEELSRAGVRHVVLKGGWLSRFYPGYGLRQMSDIDIFYDVDHKDDVGRLMADLGFQVGKDKEKDVWHFTLPPLVCFEMHGKVLTERPFLPKDYYADVWQRLQPTDRSFEYAFSGEDFYVYMMLHAYLHFRHASTGLRIFADMLVCQQALEIDEAFVDAEAKKLGILPFVSSLRAILQKLLDGAPLSEEEESMLNKMAAGGTYGTFQGYISNLMERKTDGDYSYGGKTKYILSRLWPGKEAIFTEYPCCRKLPLLLPAFVFWRFLYAACVRPHRIWREIRFVFKK